MKALTASRLAWSLWAEYAASTVTFLLLMSLNGEADYLLESLPILFAFTAFATFGALGRGRAVERTLDEPACRSEQRSHGPS